MRVSQHRRQAGEVRGIVAIVIKEGWLHSPERPSRWRQEPLPEVVPSQGPALRPPGVGWAAPPVQLRPRGLGWAQAWVLRQGVGCSSPRELGSARRRWFGRGQAAG